MTQRQGARIACHNIRRRTIICELCGAAWEERYIGLILMTGHGDPVCPRCLPPTLTVEGMIEAEVSITLLHDQADPAAIRQNVTERYQKFSASAPPAPPESQTKPA
jgi:hypothetical protein